MSILYSLSSVALRQAIGDGAEHLLKVVSDRLTDHSQALPTALQRSNERAWKTLEIALAGEGLLNKFDAAEERAFRGQIQGLMESMPLPLLSGKKEFRNDCLRELRAARQQGMLLGPINAEQMKKTLGAHGSQVALVESDRAALTDMGTLLHQSNFKNLAHLVSHPVQPDQALLVVAVRYFFRRELETNESLARGLQFNMMETLTDAQRQGFQQLETTLSHSGQKVERALDDLGGELDKIGKEIDQLKQMMQQLLALNQMQQQREVRPGMSRSIRGEGDKRKVREVVERYQALPAPQRQQRPDLLSDVAMLQIASGQCADACENFNALSLLVHDDPQAQAQAQYNVYRAALEQRDWERALQALLEATRLVPDKYAPFPLEKYEPQRILGAGGFGVAFLCQHTATRGRRVIKTLQLDGLDRDVSAVFEEARVLESLEHDSIIRLRDCDFADRQRTRGYLVMDFFEGMSLGDYVKTQGALSTQEMLPLARVVAEAMLAAHERNVLHRDLKPDNLLVRREERGWKVKLIDFGLAVKQEIAEGTVRTPAQRTPSPDSFDIAGTMEYAAPEQLGQLQGVPVGPYSDVYGFARTCYYALLNTSQPDDGERETLDTNWRKLLSECTARKPEKRLQSFAVVLERLRTLDNIPVATPCPPPVRVPTPPMKPTVRATPKPPPPPPVEDEPIELEIIAEPEPPPRQAAKRSTVVPSHTLSPSNVFKQPTQQPASLSDLWGAASVAPEAAEPAPAKPGRAGLGGAFGAESPPEEAAAVEPPPVVDPPPVDDTFKPKSKPKRGGLGGAFG